MRIILALILCISTSVFASELKQSKDQQLAHLLATMNVLYESKTIPLVRVIQSWDAISECSGTVESCPDTRLLVTSSMGDLDETPLLYELPKAKGWQLVSAQDSGDQLIIKLETTLDQANIEPKSRNNWHSQKFSLKISKSTGEISSD